MPKKIFWPATLVLMGLIFLASNMGYLPATFWNFWPLILIIVGLGGLLTSDREEWLVEYENKPAKKTTKKSSTTKKSAAKSKSSSKKTTAKKSSKKKTTRKSSKKSK